MNYARISFAFRSSIGVRLAARKPGIARSITFSFALLIILAACPFINAQQTRRSINLDDAARMRDVRDPQCSPDGKSIAYVVGTTDAKADKRNAHIWMIGADGSHDVQLTESQDSEGSPRFSPDGRYISFTSSRPGKTKGNQVWLLDRQGGEAVQLTDEKGRLQSYEWSPDSKRLALVIGDPDPEADQADAAGAGADRTPKAPKPIVIDRYHYKQDVAGYLLSGRHSYIYLFDIATKKTDRLTKGNFDESNPVWSPDGTRIAFTSNHLPDPDRLPDPQLFLANAQPGAVENQITKFDARGVGGRPAWSPDGKWIAFLVGDEKKWGAYNMSRLAMVPADGSAQPTILTNNLDRAVSSPYFSEDGKSIVVLESDDRWDYPISITVAGQAVQKMLSSPVVLNSITHSSGCLAALSTSDKKATEIYALEGGNLRQLTHQNDALFAELQLGDTQDVSFKAADGTEVHGLLTLPAGYVQGTKLPFLLRIHGGPNGQDSHGFNYERQIFAANGYAVLNVNYRGSSGRGQAFQRAIAADWGHYEVIDLKAGIDHVVQMGVADPNRLGVGGWSYGCILTDYMIASDPRLKAATCGAGTAFTVAFYGTDQYIIQYDNEIGPPWNPKSWETYVKLSYPFLHADRIKTPTLWLNGEKDFNVPIQGNEQMYEALKSLGVPTELVIYPNEFHGIQRPSYQRDRYERYMAWYEKYLKNSGAAATTTTTGGN
ncbi:MAG TPA: S9 family peptidase [Candidatus Acidoferrales bacterium]|nr:S9 family peptidase [Candidatus Acidoferrales bacterium]